MAIERIDAELCNGCAICSDTCSSDVIRIDERTKKAFIKYPQDCTVCGLCELECPKQAIFVSPVMRGAP